MFPGYGIHQELAYMVRAGVTPLQALADIANTKRIAMVIQRGRPVDRGSLNIH